MEHKLSDDDLYVLEEIIDSSSLRQLVSALVQLAHEKAEHIRTNWQDRPLANDWNRAGNLLETLEDRLTKLGV